MSGANFTVIDSTKGRRLRLPFSLLQEIKEEILGKKYDASLVLVGEKKSRVLNMRYRGKNEPANVLSFPIAKNEGEIVLSPVKARKDAPRFHMPPRQFILFIYIHGLLHLKGYRHGGTMEKKEREFLKEYARFLRY